MHVAAGIGAAVAKLSGTVSHKADFFHFLEFISLRRVPDPESGILRSHLGIQVVPLQVEPVGYVLGHEPDGHPVAPVDPQDGRIVGILMGGDGQGALLRRWLPEMDREKAGYPAQQQEQPHD